MMDSSQVAAENVELHRRGSGVIENQKWEGEDPADEENCLTDSPLKFCCTTPWYMFWLVWFLIIQGITATGLMASSLTSLEKRYNLSSTTTGILYSTFDCFVVVFAPFVAYYGGKGNTPRFMGIGLAALGVGNIIFSLPHFLSGKYELGSSCASGSGSLCDTDVCHTDRIFFEQSCHNGGTDYLFLFFLGQAGLGLCSACLYSLGPAYLDQIVSNVKLPKYLATFYVPTALGPAIGFAIASIFLNIWVDIGEKPEGMRPEDEEWVGAWWLGYIILGVCALVFSIPFFMYPRFIPGTAHVRETHRKEQIKIAGVRDGDEHEKSMWSQVVIVMKNPPTVFQIFAISLEAFVITGYAAFLPKWTESLFGLTSSQAALLMGIVVIPGAAGGIAFGAYLVRRLNLSGAGAAKMNFILSLMSLACMFGFFIGCPTVKLAGVTAKYADNTIGNLTATCNLDCSFDCDPDRYSPVCGSDDRVYLNGCYAGCLERDGGRFDTDASYSNCSCIDSGLGSAEKGKCDTGCNALYPFLITLFVGMFLIFMNNVPAAKVTLHSVPLAYRPVAMGVRNATWRLLGAVPGPILFGVLIDSACDLHATKCGEELDNCWEYDTVKLRLLMVLLGAVPKTGSAICFFLSWWTFKDAEEHGGVVAPLGGRKSAGQLALGSSQSIDQFQAEDN